MLVEKKIENYVKEAVSNLPLRARRGAKEALTAYIYDMMDDYAGEGEADIITCRQVLKDLGAPDDMAEMYIDSIREEEGQPARRHREFRLSGAQVRKVLQVLSSMLIILAGCLVFFGLVALGTKMINSMLPVFVGVVLALITIVIRGISESVSRRRLHGIM